MYKVVLADDKSVFLRQIQRFECIKDNADFEIVATCQNGEEVLDILNTTKVDLVITDIRMPILDGLELLEMIRKDNLCPCVILLSEYADFEYAKRGLQLGAFEYFVKPINAVVFENILEKVKKYLISLQQNQFHIMNSEMLISGLIKRDGIAITLASNMMDNLLQHDKSVEEYHYIIMQILNHIKSSVCDKYDWIEKYMDTNKVFSIDINKDKKTMAEDFKGKINNVYNFMKSNLPSTNNPLLEKVCEYILYNIEDNIDVKILAEKHYLSNSYLSHLFKMNTGISLNKYIMSVKLQRAKMLMQNEMGIYEIAQHLGYQDVEYFSKLFKQEYGLTPRDYRRGIEKCN